MTHQETSKVTSAARVTRRRLEGAVVSTAMQKTIVVRVDRRVAHPKYGKYYTVSKNVKAHIGDTADVRVGDTVELEETRPRSKDKRWRYVRTVRAAQ